MDIQNCGHAVDFSGRVIVNLLTWTLEPNDLEVTITTYYSTTPKNVNLRNPSYIL